MSRYLERPRIRVKRVYDEPTPDDGYRVLVDRLWPRGLSRDRARIDLWLREIAPSSELRTWFAQKAERFGEFRSRYMEELREKERLVQLLLSRVEVGETVTLLYSARDPEHNNAVVLRDYLEERLKVGGRGRG
jgi:uncharacterized protein YeaO (DUF488 family)